MRDKQLRIAVDSLRERINRLEKMLEAGFDRSFKLERHEKALAILAEKSGVKRDCNPVEDANVVWKLLGEK